MKYDTDSEYTVRDEFDTDYYIRKARVMRAAFIAQSLARLTTRIRKSLRNLVGVPFARHHYVAR